MKLSEIKPNPNNPRTISKEKFEKLCNSIKEFPQMMKLRPIVIDENNMTLGGNMRLKALKYLEYDELPKGWVVKENDLTEEQKNEFIIKDNVGYGDWEWDTLANEWDAEALDKWGLDLPVGFDEKEIKEDEAPEVSDEEPKSKLGEIYQLGNHRVMCGDSTKIGDVEKLMGGGR